MNIKLIIDSNNYNWSGMRHNKFQIDASVETQLVSAELNMYNRSLVKGDKSSARVWLNQVVRFLTAKCSLEISRECFYFLDKLFFCNFFVKYEGFGPPVIRSVMSKALIKHLNIYCRLKTLNIMMKTWIPSRKALFNIDFR